MNDAKKILIVDDEEELLALLGQALELRGFSVITTTNAVEAGMALAVRCPDIILMDVKMPGINGYQACEAIKRNPDTKDIPIIIVSALSDDADMKRAYKIGVNGYYTKPVDIEQLINKIKELLK